MTQRFDRTPDGKKLHMQSLCAMRHFDFNLARAYSHEQAIETIRMLGLGRDAIKEQVRFRAAQCLHPHQDDHTKNIAFPWMARVAGASHRHSMSCTPTIPKGTGPTSIRCPGRQDRRLRS